jgi:NAD(P)-dependent dehydrogenase (short-subunit alcohol dehydrogenase family)
MPVALVLGASRGIGLEFTRQYLAQGWQVHATCRAEADRIRLRDLGAHTLKLDVLDLNDVAGVRLAGLDGEHLDVAICNAGVYGPRNSGAGIPPSLEQFDTVMRTNVLRGDADRPRRRAAAGTSARHAGLHLQPDGIDQPRPSASYGLLYRTSKAAINIGGPTRPTRTSIARA